MYVWSIWEESTSVPYKGVERGCHSVGISTPVNVEEINTENECVQRALTLHMLPNVHVADVKRFGCLEKLYRNVHISRWGHQKTSSSSASVG